ncbi:hypothetical protein SOVF_120780 [Spinacia oleracea]|nr:hypothetical protein SOVF_120780 [Spinacia oleracea]
MMMKRGKIASKVALNTLIFHHYHHNNPTVVSSFKDGVPKPSHLQSSTTTDAAAPLGEFDDEFICPTTPFYTPLSAFGGTVRTDSFEASNKKQMMVRISSSSKGGGGGGVIRQLRITDSPFPLQSEEDRDPRVDQAAEAFIKRFYSQLKKQSCE